MIIDVSHHQGKIDWARVKPQIDAAILRCGYSTSGKDRMWEYNAAECERLGIPYGVYFYSYAQNVPSAAIEAQHCLDLLKGRHISGHVWFDSEQDGTQAVARSAADLFCRTMKSAGYKPGIYASESWFKKYLKGMGYPTWVAKYGANNGAAGVRPNIGETVNMWQYTSRGQVRGITGGVDVSQIITAFDAVPAQRLFVGQVTASVLNVRAKPSTLSPKLKEWPRLAKGNLVDVYAVSGGWYYVRIAGKYFGYVSAKYIKRL